MATILIVEDDPDWQHIYRLNFIGHTVHVAARTQEARRLYREHEESITFIILDGYLTQHWKDRGEQTTLELAKEFRLRGFKGPLLAASGDDYMCEQLTKAGCSHSVKGQKRHTVTIALKILEELAA